MYVLIVHLCIISLFLECVFLDQSKVAFDSASESGEVPRIGLEEMLDDLNLEDQEMASDEE